jgi:tetratricopeptide (TPR) repeat protein
MRELTTGPKANKSVENLKKNTQVATQIEPTFTYKEAAPQAAKSDKNKYVYELLVNAETLMKFDERELAKGLVSRALAMDSKNPMALKKLSKSILADVDLKQKIRIGQEICKSESNFETVSELAHLYFRSGQDQEALKLYFESLNISVDSENELFDIYKNIGIILTREGDYEGAEENFNKAFCLNPKSDSLAVNLGTLAVQQYDYTKALERFRSAIEFNPKNDKAWVGLALVHNQMGDHELAFGNIARAVELNKNNRTAIQLFASWANRDCKYQSAIEVLENYLSSVELDEEMSFILVHMFCQLNQFDFALMEIERVLLWNPQNESAARLEMEIRKLKKV